MEKDQIAKLVCIAIGCVAGFYIFMWMLPYIELFLALCGGWYLFEQHQKNNRNDRNRRR